MMDFNVAEDQWPVIKVIGVGGAGCNAVAHLYSLGVSGAELVISNTDSQALALTPECRKVFLGKYLTQGLGAGANPEIGKQACEESIDEIRAVLSEGIKIVFITAGMGGGTGTGGAPVIAKLCRELNILTVGVVTTPFKYEGRKRREQAVAGVAQLKEFVDTIVVVSNDKLREKWGNLPFTQAFAKADDVLATAIKCLIDIVSFTGQINVDISDILTVMRNGGHAVFGLATARGGGRALKAAEEALNCPLLDKNDIYGAKWVLLNIISSPGEYEHTMDEAEEIQEFIHQKAGCNCDIILGMGNDISLEDKISVTVIATGFHHGQNLITTNKQDIVLDDRILPDEKYPDWLAEKEQVILPDIPDEETEIQLVIRSVTPIADVFLSKRDANESSMDEQQSAERKRFEEQKKALEERAERLRRMTFSIYAAEFTEDLEIVPAYLRQNIQITSTQGSSSVFYSQYSVGVGEPQQDERASIQTINTFLDGKKPD